MKTAVLNEKAKLAEQHRQQVKEVKSKKIMAGAEAGKVFRQEKREEKKLARQHRQQVKEVKAKKIKAGAEAGKVFHQEKTQERKLEGFAKKMIAAKKKLVRSVAHKVKKMR